MSDDANYSSPMPVIGLYIAGATLVCFLIILCDIVNGARQKKPWMPCRFFVLNSLTLTLLSVATKLPVDLTTSMPSAYDQLSKLCGTCLLCISIGFFYPSVGNVRESELFSNLASLTIMVITVTVNIFIQMTTGAIFLFKLEHTISLVSMLLLLALINVTAHFSPSFYLIGPYQEAIRSKPRDHTDSLLGNCYFFSYVTNPQLLICRFASAPTVSMLCIICFVALSEAAIRAFHLEGPESLFRKDACDYKWSIWVVLAIQFLTLTVGTLAIALRWIVFPSHTSSFNLNMLPNVSIKLRSFFLDVCKLLLNAYKLSSVLNRNWELYFLGFKSFPREIFHIFQVLQNILGFALHLIGLWATCMDLLGNFIVRMASGWVAWATRKTGFCFGFLTKCDAGFDPEIVASINNELRNYTSTLNNELRNISPFLEVLYSADYFLWKVKEDMEMFAKKHATDPVHSLVPFLRRSTTTTTHGHVLLPQINEQSDKLLLLVCLVRTVDAIVPPTRSGCLASAFDEIFETLVFIHDKTKPKLVFGTIKTNMAKDIWISRSNSCHWFQSDYVKHLKKGSGGTVAYSSAYDCVFKIVQASSVVAHAFRELLDIFEIIGQPLLDIINGKDGAASMEEGVYNRMEQLFVELLHWYIDRFPDAVFNSLTEARVVDELEENVKLSLKGYTKLRRLELNWGCIGTNITTFMTTDHPFDASPNQQVLSESAAGINDVSDQTIHEEYNNEIA